MYDPWKALNLHEIAASSFWERGGMTNCIVSNQCYLNLLGVNNFAWHFGPTMETKAGRELLTAEIYIQCHSSGAP